MGNVYVHQTKEGLTFYFVDPKHPKKLPDERLTWRGYKQMFGATPHPVAFRPKSDTTSENMKMMWLPLEHDFRTSLITSREALSKERQRRARAKSMRIKGGVVERRPRDPAGESQSFHRPKPSDAKQGKPKPHAASPASYPPNPEKGFAMWGGKNVGRRPGRAKRPKGRRRADSFAIPPAASVQPAQPGQSAPTAVDEALSEQDDTLTMKPLSYWKCQCGFTNSAQ